MVEFERQMFFPKWRHLGICKRKVRFKMSQEVDVSMECSESFRSSVERCSALHIARHMYTYTKMNFSTMSKDLT